MTDDKIKTEVKEFMKTAGWGNRSFTNKQVERLLNIFTNKIVKKMNYIPCCKSDSEQLKDDDFRCIQESSQTGRCKCLKEEDCVWAD